MIIYLLLLTILLFLVYRKRTFFALSPVDIFIGYYLAVIIFTTLYHYYYPRGEKINFYNLDMKNHKNYADQLVVFLRVVTLFLFGVFLYKLFNPKYNAISRKPIEIVNIKDKKINYKQLSNIAVALLIICLILAYIDYGNQLFIRKKYIPEDGSPLKLIYTNLMMFLSVLSGILMKRSKTVAWLSLLTVLLIGICLGSRVASICLILYGITYSLFLESRKGVLLFYSFFIPFATIFFGYNISLRSEAFGHGLIPYLSITFSKPQIIFEYTVRNIYYTFIFGFYATSETIKLYTFATIDNLITCMSPLPGRMVNWYQIHEKLRINIYAPFSAIGELAKFPVFSFFYYIFLGFYFSVIDAFVKKSIIDKRYIFAVLQVLMLLLFIMFSYEYNLRSTNRFIWHSFFLLLLARYFKKVKRIKFVYKQTNKEE